MLGSAVLTSRQPRHRTFGRTHRAWKGGEGGGRLGVKRGTGRGRKEGVRSGVVERMLM